MRLPRKLKVKNAVYRLSFVKRINDRGDYGMCDGVKRTIQILMGLSNRDRLETFMHELDHAIEFEWNIPVPHGIMTTMNVHRESVFHANDIVISQKRRGASA
jgi:hypothetical protein